MLDENEMLPEETPEVEQQEAEAVQAEVPAAEPEEALRGQPEAAASTEEGGEVLREPAAEPGLDTEDEKPHLEPDVDLEQPADAVETPEESPGPVEAPEVEAVEAAEPEVGESFGPEAPAPPSETTEGLQLDPALAETQEAEEALETPAEEQEPDDGRRWYVIHCYSGYENKVRHNLEQRIETMDMKDKIFDVVVPTEEEIEVKEGKRRTVERRVFPGYILVQMIMDEDSWYVVRNTPGVTGFVGMGNEPTPLRPEEVAQIVKRMEAEAPRIKVTYKPGQKVRIIDGPFNDFIGTVDEIDMERAKVRVMVSFFGRETPVELDFLQVEKA